MKCENMTQSGGTMTTEGFIPHKRHDAGFDMPVQLHVDDTLGVRGMMGPQMPVRSKSGSLVYALPGGGSFVGGEA